MDVSNPAQTRSSRNATLTVLSVPPSNDNFANATILSGTNPATGYTFGATSESGEPNHAFVSGGHSVWWAWTAPNDGDFRVSVVATNLGDPFAAALYTGATVTALTPVTSAIGFSSKVGADNISVVSFAVQATGGTHYSLALDHGGTGDGFLSLTIAASSRPVIGVSATVSGGSFGFDFSAPPGAMYDIEASTDLRTWNIVASGNVPPNGIVSLTQPMAADATGHFYRIRLQ